MNYYRIRVINNGFSIEIFLVYYRVEQLVYRGRHITNVPKWSPIWIQMMFDAA